MLKNWNVLLCCVSLLTYLPSFAQEENWDAYIAEYENGPGSIILNMELIRAAPRTDLSFVLITGVSFQNCREDGFPQEKEFPKLHAIADHIQEIIQKLTKHEQAGSFTYQCEQLHYSYVSDTTTLRQALHTYYQQLGEGYTPYINIKPDPNWKAYREFLYPSEEIMGYMSNEKVLMQLQEAGDDLSKARKVDHWLYFAQKNALRIFMDYAKKEGYIIESQEQLENTELPYQVRISRKDFVYPNSIHPITQALRLKARALGGEYDGWETFVIKTE